MTMQRQPADSGIGPDDFTCSVLRKTLDRVGRGHCSFMWQALHAVRKASDERHKRIRSYTLFRPRSLWPKTVLEALDMPT